MTLDNDKDDVDYPMTIIITRPDDMVEHYDLDLDSPRWDVEIVDDEPKEWELTVSDEKDGSLDFTVWLDGPPTRRLEVKYQTEDVTARDARRRRRSAPTTGGRCRTRRRTRSVAPSASRSPTHASVRAPGQPSPSL